MLFVYAKRVGPCFQFISDVAFLVLLVPPAHHELKYRHSEMKAGYQSPMLDKQSGIWYYTLPYSLRLSCCLFTGF